MFLSQVYSEYRASLAFDLVSSRQKNVRSSLFVSKHYHSVIQMTLCHPHLWTWAIISGCVFG